MIVISVVLIIIFWFPLRPRAAAVDLCSAAGFAPRTGAPEGFRSSHSVGCKPMARLFNSPGFNPLGRPGRGCHCKNGAGERPDQKLLGVRLVRALRYLSGDA